MVLTSLGAKSFLATTPQVQNPVHLPGVLHTERKPPELPNELRVPKADVDKVPQSGSPRSGSSALSVRAMVAADPATVDPKVMAQAFQSVLAGADPEELSPTVLQTLQTVALEGIRKEFTNQFHTDGTLLEQAGTKLGHYSVRPTQPVMDAIFGKGEVTQRQADALVFVLRTFQSDGDRDLRMAALDKLQFVGRAEDLDAVLPSARKGMGFEVAAALNAITAITAREGIPVERGGLASDPEIGPLLNKSYAALTRDERTQIIEAALDRGTIAEMKKREGGTNRHDVYFITFAERLGVDGPSIRAVFKPEASPGDPWALPGFSREVAVYQGLERFLKTGTITPVAETILPVPGQEGGRLGSIQYMVPHSHEMGCHDDMGRLNPRFEKFLHTDQAGKDLMNIRVLCFIAGCGDHFMNTDHAYDSPIYNYNNFLVTFDAPALDALCKRHNTDPEGLLNLSNSNALPAEDERTLFANMHILPIDFGAALGNQPGLIKQGILPGQMPAGSAEKVRSLPVDALKPALAEVVRPNDAEDVGMRIGYVASKTQ